MSNLIYFCTKCKMHQLLDFRSFNQNNSKVCKVLNNLWKNTKIYKDTVVRCDFKLLCYYNLYNQLKRLKKKLYI